MITAFERFRSENSFTNCDNYGIRRASNPNPLNDDNRTNDYEYISSYVEHLLQK